MNPERIFTTHEACELFIELQNELNKMNRLTQQIIETKDRQIEILTQLVNATPSEN
jgi:hypothetical protein